MTTTDRADFKSKVVSAMRSLQKNSNKERRIFPKTLSAIRRVMSVYLRTDQYTD
jgi:hypothetical protein